MKNEEILKKVIEKAVKNGYDMLGWDSDDLDLFTIIFSHDFAKAFFGEEIKDFEHCSDTDGNVNCPLASWKGNLQQMVLEDDPIQYLKQFLDV